MEEEKADEIISGLNIKEYSDKAGKFAIIGAGGLSGKTMLARGVLEALRAKNFVGVVIDTSPEMREGEIMARIAHLTSADIHTPAGLLSLKPPEQEKIFKITKRDCSDLVQYQTKEEKSKTRAGGNNRKIKKRKKSKNHRN